MRVICKLILSIQGKCAIKCCKRLCLSVGNGVHLQCPPLISQAEPIIGLNPRKHGPLNPITHISNGGAAADSQENRLFKESAPQQFTFLGEKVKGEEVGAGLVTGKKD